MDEELPRTNSSINNRSDLRKILHLEGLYKKNKVLKWSAPVLKISRMVKKQRDDKMHVFRLKNIPWSQCWRWSWRTEWVKVVKPKHADIVTIKHIHWNKPHSVLPQTWLEMLRLRKIVWKICCATVQGILFDKNPVFSFAWDFQDLLTALNIHLLHRLSESSLSQVIVPPQTPSEKQRKNFAVHPEGERSMYCSSYSQDSLLTVSNEGFPSEKKVVNTDSPKSRSSKIRRGIMAGPIASSSQVINVDSLN